MAWEDRRGHIDREGPALVYQQIADDLAAMIESGELSPRSRLPSEQALADNVYGVARPTVRRAISVLVDRGLLVVIHGRGTFVVER